MERKNIQIVSLDDSIIYISSQYLCYHYYRNPYVDSDFEDDEDDYIKPMRIDIDLGLSAYANSRK